MKKLSLLVIVAVVVAVVTTCVDPEGNIVNPFYDFGELRTPHEHEWGEWTVSRSASCVEEGELIRACADDESHFDRQAIPIDPDAHDWEVREDENYVPPTCTEPGYGFLSCSLCQKFEVNGEIAPLGHEFELYELTSLPNCSTPGTETAHCVRQTSGCDATDEHFIPIDPDAHEWNDEYEVTTPATCSAEGEETDTCAFNAEHIRTRETDIDPDAHDWNDVYQLTTAATCMTGGEETTYCYYNIMHTQSRETAVDPDAHVYDTYLTLTAATCSEEGAEQGTCVYNRSHTPDRRAIPIDPDAHDYGEWIFIGMVGIAGTCTEAGEETSICSRNAAHLQKRDTPVNPDAHNWNNVYKITKVSTCSEEGVTTDTCRNTENLEVDKQHTRTKSVPIDIMAHKYENYQLRNSWETPNCSRTGINRSPCSYDPDHDWGMLVTPIDPNAHNYVSYTVTTPATCTATGTETAPCARNADHTRGTRTVAVNPNAHNYATYTETTAATCSATGVETAPCTRDPNHTKGTRTLAINPSAHNYGSYAVIDAATCSAAGSQKRTCSHNSSHTETQTIDINPSAHNWGSYTVTTDADCVRTGSQTRTCTLSSSHVDTQTIPIDPNRHYWKANGANTYDPDAPNIIWDTSIAATCTTAGEDRNDCMNGACNGYRTKAVAARGHNYSFPYYWEPSDENTGWGLFEGTRVAATCSSTGTEKRRCTRLDANGSFTYTGQTFCGDEQTRTIPINPDAHQYTNTYLAPSNCTYGNKYDVKCSLNSAHDKIDYDTARQPNNHDWSAAWVYNPVPTVRENGTRTKTCGHNSAHTQSETAYATGTVELTYSAVFYRDRGNGYEYSVDVTSFEGAAQGSLIYLPEYVLQERTLGGQTTRPGDYVKVTGITDYETTKTFGTLAISRYIVMGSGINFTVAKNCASYMVDSNNPNLSAPGMASVLLYNKAETELIMVSSLATGTIEVRRNIGDYAFRNCTHLDTVIVQDTVMSVGLGAFSGMTFSQTIRIRGPNSEAAADNLWGGTYSDGGSPWRSGCRANRLYGIMAGGW